MMGIEDSSEAVPLEMAIKGSRWGCTEVMGIGSGAMASGRVVGIKDALAAVLRR